MCSSCLGGKAGTVLGHQITTWDHCFYIFIFNWCVVMAQIYGLTFR